jgi:hypothetical protein
VRGTRILTSDNWTGKWMVFAVVHASVLLRCDFGLLVSCARICGLGTTTSDVDVLRGSRSSLFTSRSILTLVRETYTRLYELTLKISRTKFLTIWSDSWLRRINWTLYWGY